MRKSWRFSLCAAMLTTLLFPPTSGFAQSPVRECGGSAPPAWCAAAQGDRPSGWLRQGRSEVMARHGIVATSQPLAAQAGLRILMAGTPSMPRWPRRRLLT